MSIEDYNSEFRVIIPNYNELLYNEVQKIQNMHILVFKKISVVSSYETVQTQPKLLWFEAQSGEPGMHFELFSYNHIIYPGFPLVEHDETDSPEITKAKNEINAFNEHIHELQKSNGANLHIRNAEDLKKLIQEGYEVHCFNNPKQYKKRLVEYFVEHRVLYMIKKTPDEIYANIFDPYAKWKSEDHGYDLITKNPEIFNPDGSMVDQSLVDAAIKWQASLPVNKTKPVPVSYI